ncbi:MAG: GIY-YIG nuclease family protein [Thiobacillus sp.]|nr:GIY-YIG nuclease family protein [Thiobacillus sp.]
MPGAQPIIPPDLREKPRRLVNSNVSHLRKIMSVGFVYILFNPAMPGLVKIGLSKRTSKTRAKELRGTGVPDDFAVVYDELVTDCTHVETRIHERFDGYRYKPNREFFQIPIRDAIRGLMEVSVGFVVPRIGVDCGIEILPDLKKKYPEYLKSDFHSIKIIHADGLVYLESVRYRHAGLRDEVIERTDLGFIVDEDDEMFPSTRNPEDNARLFVHQLDEYSMIHCTDLFTQDACEKIALRHERG